MKDKIEKAMEKNNLDQFTNIYVGWDNEKRILVIVEKRKTKSGVVYESHALKISIIDDKMQKTFSVRTTKDSEHLGVFLRQTVSDLESEVRRNDQGIVVRDPQTCLNMLMTTPEGAKTHFSQGQSFPQNPVQHVSGRLIGYACNYNLSVTNNPIMISDSMLLHHCCITGSTGGGKTEIAKRIVSEINKDQKTVMILTPEPELWKKMNNTFVVDDEAVEGKVNVINFNDPVTFNEDSVKLLENLINHYINTEQTSNLKLLLVIDEAHQFNEEVIEKAVRVLRKYGVGIILISHTYTDFGRGIRSNIQTHIALYTNWEKDISFIRGYQHKNGQDFANLLRHMPEGYGIIRSRELYRNEPIPCKFLTVGEILQTTELREIYSSNNISNSETDQRRHAILEFIEKNAGCMYDNIIEPMKGKVAGSTLYKDLDWLESQGLIEVIKTGDRGKKRYVKSD